MDGRTIPLHGGGELTIGGGPLIEGLIHGWVRKERGRGGNFMISVEDAEFLAGRLRRRENGRIQLFAGKLVLSQGGDVAILWFYPWGGKTPDFAARLYDGAIDRAAEALSELCEFEEALSKGFDKAAGSREAA